MCPTALLLMSIMSLHPTKDAVSDVALTWSTDLSQKVILKNERVGEYLVKVEIKNIAGRSLYLPPLSIMPSQDILQSTLSLMRRTNSIRFQIALLLIIQILMK